MLLTISTRLELPGMLLACMTVACSTPGGSARAGAAHDAAPGPGDSSASPADAADAAEPFPDAAGDELAGEAPDAGLHDAEAPADVDPDPGSPPVDTPDQPADGGGAELDGGDGGATPGDAAADAAADAADAGGQGVVLSKDAFQALLAAGDAEGILAFAQAYDMPICEGGVCLVVTVQPAGSTVEVLGGFDGWSGGTFLAESAAAPGVFHGTFAAVFEDFLEYKLKVGGEWTIDWSNRYIRHGPYGPNSAIYAPGHHRIALIPGVVSEELGNTRSLYVYLPAAYFGPGEPHLPVVYMQDGFNVFHNPLAPFGTWNVDATTDAMVAEGLAKPVIIAGIDTEDRTNEYLWAKVELEPGVYTTPKLPLYSAFLTGTVKPLIDATFRTLPDPKNTAIAGSSFGGISSMWLAWHNTGVFGRVASFSGSYWVAEDDPGQQALREIIAANAEGIEPADLVVYLDSGDTSFSGVASYGGDSWVYTDWTRNALIGQGWHNRAEWDTDGDLSTQPADLPPSTAVAKVPSLAWAPSPPPGYSGHAEYLGVGESLVCLVGHGHQHNEPAWEKRFGMALTFLFPGPEASP